MRLLTALMFLTLGAQPLAAQKKLLLESNKIYRNIPVSNTDSFQCRIQLKKKQLYQVAAWQKGMDVVVDVYNSSKQKIISKDSNNGKSGPELFYFEPVVTGEYIIVINRLNDGENPAAGVADLYVKQYSNDERILLKLTDAQLKKENTKEILTADIDHFWEAYVQLQLAKNYYDSITAIQNLYLDRATDGLIDFAIARNFNADEYVEVIAHNKSFFDSARIKTQEAKKSAPLIEEVFVSLKQLYPGFKPFKVCFAISPMRTGGTTSDRYVMIGTELTCTGDISKIALRIKGIITHECVHTQQKSRLANNAVECRLLYSCLQEGAANFIGELISGTTNYTKVNQYGDMHEKELWAEFKSSLCSNNTSHWLYNGNDTTLAGRPADMGYYVGYKIIQAYYNKAADKTAAVKQIIEMDDPLRFLAESGYDPKP